MWRTKKIKFLPGKTTTREKRRITLHGGELALKRTGLGNARRGDGRSSSWVCGPRHTLALWK
ncbi:MAG TPA: hypothetical protein VF658_21615 [Pyrinomonadaceae bacterium]